MDTGSSGTTDAETGCRAAQRLWKAGLQGPEIEDPLTTEFALAALAEFQRLQLDTAGVLRDVLEGAQMSAEQLSVVPFQGLMEVIQNADDLHAREVRVAIRTVRGRSTMLMAHDGDRVRLEHVVAMALAYISTKRDDPRAKGRFGIGLKTLGRIGDNLAVHCSPYHFEIEQSTIRAKTPAKTIKGFYDVESTDTLLQLQLRPDFDVDSFQSWVGQLGAESLIFLDTVRSLRFVNLESGRVISHHRLRESQRDTVDLPNVRGSVQRSVLRVPRTKRSWVRYLAEPRVPKGLTRRHKAVGATTPVAVAVPMQPEPFGQLYAGLPLGIRTDFPFSVNAQFDVDTARQGIQHEELNKWLFRKIGELTAAAALVRIEDVAAQAWQAIPLTSEDKVADDDWLSERAADLIEDVHRIVCRRFRIEIGGKDRKLSDLAYETAPLEGLIGPDELVGLKPELALVPVVIRDREARWRSVLTDLGDSTVVDVGDALQLLDWEEEDLGQRDVRWFIRLARAALDEDLGSTLWDLRAIVTSNGQRIIPPMPDSEARLLLRSEVPGALASRLGIAHVIHEDYLSRSPHAVVVRKWLEENDMLRKIPDSDATLRALAAKAQEESSILVDDESLLLLRKSFEEIEPEQRAKLGEDIGHVILVDVQRWLSGKRVSESGYPGDAYLPASIEDRRDGWSKAAARTPGISWIHPRYDDLLRRPRRRGERGLQRSLGSGAFFRLLGAEIAPRLVEPDRYETRYNDPASPIDQDNLTVSQKQAVESFSRWPTHLKNERLSPDLRRVLNSIRVEKKVRQRRERVDALLKTIEREWSRLYANHLKATAVFSDSSWQKAGDLATSWIAQAIDDLWLRNEAGKLRTARQLAVRTPATEAIFGQDRDRFTRELNASHSQLRFVQAMRIETDPRVSEMVDQLREFREQGGPVDSSSLALRYAAIAVHCDILDPKPDDLVGDLTVRQLRGRFGSSHTKSGLFYSDGNWIAPSTAFLGAPIFGGRRVFVSGGSASKALWQTLGVKRPVIDDCIDFLKEIAGDVMDQGDEESLVNTYLYLEKLCREYPGHRALPNLPLWTGSSWESGRPVFLVTDPDVAIELRGRIPIWDLPVAYTAVPNLISEVDVQILDEDSFNPLVNAQAYSNGVSLANQFSNAIGLLEDWLTRHDQVLSGSHSLGWSEMQNAILALDPNLRLEIQINGRTPATARSRAHLARDPLTFYFSDPSAIGRDDAGGRVMAALFDAGDKDKLALAWSHCWERALQGEKGSVGLAEEGPKESGLEELYKQADRIQQPIRKATATPRKVRKQVSPNGGKELEPRRLKKLDGLIEKRVAHTTDSDTQGTTRRGRRGLKKDTPTGRLIGAGTSSGSRSAPLAYSEIDKEDLALTVLQAAINGESTELRDYRHLRGVGADAVDKLRRYFEIKSFYGPLPDEVELTANEAERAFVMGDKFFLAVIAGLEEGYETVVRIYSDPLHVLSRKWPTSTILEGITKNTSAGIEVTWADEDVD